MDFSKEICQLMDEGKVENAILRMQERLKTDERNDHLHYLLGNAYSKLSNWQMALEHYAEAEEINEHSPAKHAKEMLLNILEYRCKDLLNP